MRPSPAQSTKLTPSLKCKQVDKQARDKAKRMRNDKLTTARVLEQLRMENVALNTATSNSRDRARAEPNLFKNLWQQSKQNETEKSVARATASYEAPNNSALPTCLQSIAVRNEGREEMLKK